MVIESDIYQKEQFKNSYIYVNTNFKRNGEPIFALAFSEPKRRISLSSKEELFSKTKEEVFEFVSNFVKSHYLQNNGNLGIWGDIDTYQLNLDNQVYVFDREGIFLPLEIPKIESYATVGLK
ncbi:MAG: hypothetical protein EOM78_04145 [Erysipelotrichia bacterium]|nr:hypothetical protein [Erysipelotrichia bacterium]